MDTHRDGYDILSLLAATIESFPDNPSLEEEMLSHICVEETSFWKEDPLGAGRSCTVVETPPGLLVKNIDSKCRRPTVAKMILLRRNKYILRSPKNESSMRSMATELFVLRNRYLAKHPHVVDLLGVSWGVSNGPDEQVMPVFVLERAELGDLASFTRQTPAMSLAEQLVLAMHVALGLQAVHDVGVIHGDIKPENILVFLGCDNRPIAKLADFGSAVLLSEERSTSHRPTGTPLWQSPWSARPQTKHLLLRSDIYSLALVLSILITGLDYETLGTLEPETLHELKTLDKLADFLFQRILAAENDFPSGETTTTLNLKRFLFALTLSPNPDQDVTQALVKGMGVLKILKALLHLVVSKRARKDPDYVCSLGPLERDAYLKPSEYINLLAEAYDGRRETDLL
jgi:serine/threonine protein kinase